MSLWLEKGLNLEPNKILFFQSKKETNAYKMK